MKRPISPDTTSPTAARDDDDDSAPPLPKSTKNYVTPAGFKRLKDEALQLLDKERPDLVKVVQWAASNGDRSENADYIYGKKRLREIDSRIHFLRKRLDDLTVVRASPLQTDKIFFGAWVTLEDSEGDQVRYRLVGPDESDAKSFLISVDSPVGRALLGRVLDDEVQVVRPRGNTTYTIVDIAYEKPANQ